MTTELWLFFSLAITSLLTAYYARECRLALLEARKWRQSHESLLVSFANREAELFADAERLAGAVRQYIADIDATATLLKDETPPQLTAERSALRHHDKIKCTLSTSAHPKNP